MNKKLITTLVMSSLVASAFAVNAGAASDKQVLANDKGQVHTVVGKLGTVSGATAADRALAALDKVGKDFGFAKAASNFKVKSSHKDELGVSHTKLDQVINGIQVFGNQMIVHELNGDVQGVSGTFETLAPNATQAKLNENRAIKAAVASTGFTGDLSRPATAELGYVADGDQAVLAYKVEVAYLGDAPARNFVYVNAVDGSIVKSINVLAEVTGTGIGSLGETRSLNTTYRSGAYYLEDTTKPMSGILRTRDMKNRTRFIYEMPDTDNVWNTSYQAAAVDAHYYAGIVYDWYYNNVGRNSIDGNGMSIESLVHYSRGYNNAFWDGAEMVYGDGDGSTFRSFTAGLDVIGHEMTHGVTEHTSGLVYSDQSGALNESWSDAMGAVIEGGDWLMGEDLYISGNGAIRDMADPSRYGQPETMSQYVYTTDDNGGVHTNSGIPNYAFYKFATAIGSRDIAGKVWYVADRDYMGPNTDFSGARAATLQATAALYGSGSSYYSALQTAWSQVGVY